METNLNNLPGHEQQMLAIILKLLKSLRYGSIQITVQDSVVVQIEKTEKIRLDKSKVWHYEI